MGRSSGDGRVRWDRVQGCRVRWGGVQGCRVRWGGVQGMTREDVAESTSDCLFSEDVCFRVMATVFVKMYGSFQSLTAITSSVLLYELPTKYDVLLSLLHIINVRSDNLCGLVSEK